MNYRRLCLNTRAISLVQDTLLFLVFISISALILTPAIIQSSSNDYHYDHLVESKVDETLLTLLSMTRQNYSYVTGINYINDLATTIGIDTSQNNGLYKIITSHFLSKQQLHKSIAQLITENLATQYTIVNDNITLKLNPFAGDSQQQLTKLLSTELIRLLPPQTFFNLTAYWYPIRNIPFGGRISIGDPIPTSISTYSSNQILSMPFLPCLELENDTFCFSSTLLKQSIKPFSQKIEPLHNITLLCNQSLTNNEINRSGLLSENISSFLFEMLLYGVRTQDNVLVIPSVIDVLFNHVFSSSTFSLSTEQNSDNLENDFEFVDNLFTTISIENSDCIIPDITTYIVSSYGQILNRYIDSYVLSTISDFIVFIKQNICQLLHPLIIRISDQLSNQVLSKNTSIIHSNLIIDTVFDYLSLSTASISLSIWSG